MTDSLKQEYTRRITSANKSDLTVIMMDMFQQYIRDAVSDCDEEKYSDMHSEIGKARRVLSSLISSLNHEYEIAGNLYEIYRFIERELILSDVRREKEGLLRSAGLMNKLRDAFAVIAEQDTDGPIMQNTETVYAGMTYGKGTLSETSSAGSMGRGFFA